MTEAPKHRWRVVISDVAGGRALLESTIAAAGFELEGDMLYGHAFEKFETPDEVRDVADDLARKIREISRLISELEMRFFAGPVHEYHDDGSPLL